MARTALFAITSFLHLLLESLFIDQSLHLFLCDSFNHSAIAVPSTFPVWVYIVSGYKSEALGLYLTLVSQELSSFLLLFLVKIFIHLIVVGNERRLTIQKWIGREADIFLSCSINFSLEILGVLQFFKRLGRLKDNQGVVKNTALMGTLRNSLG